MAMADSLTEQAATLLMRFGRHFNRKIPDIAMILSNTKNAGLLGALAGFAIAIALTWKLLRSPTRPRRRQRKRVGSTSATNGSTRANAVASNSEVHPSVENVKDIDVMDEVHPQKKMTLGQIIRKKLNGSRKMTCQLLGMILEESTPEELQKHATVRLSVVEVLLEITKSCDLYLMERILDDESGMSSAEGFFWL